MRVRPSPPSLPPSLPSKRKRKREKKRRLLFSTGINNFTLINFTTPFVRAGAWEAN
jgi:hypothetical protein